MSAHPPPNTTTFEFEEEEFEQEEYLLDGGEGEEEEEEDEYGEDQDRKQGEEEEDSQSSLEDRDGGGGDGGNTTSIDRTWEHDVQEEPLKLPWACRYCGLANPATVARCLESGLWFCNGMGETTASHIIQHMVRARHKELCLHPDSALGETVIECYNCSSRNLFMMGFVPKGDGIVVLLCRNCLQIGALKELEWDASNWTPLVKDKMLLPWLVKTPTEEETARSRRVTAQQIERLETLWRTHPDAEMEDLERPNNLEDEPMPVQLRYDDGFHFQNIFGPLVQIEAEYDRESKEALTEQNVSVHWAAGSTTILESNDLRSKWISAEVAFSPSASESLRLTVGDELLVSLSKRLLPPSRGAKADWEEKVTVVHLGGLGETTTVELRASSRPPLDVTEGYSVKFVWKPITFDRMQIAMKKFAVDSSAVSNYIYHKLLGHEAVEPTTSGGGGVEVRYPAVLPSAPGLPALNSSQQSAIQQVISKPLALIQGPPGTGKTVTLATLVYHMVTRGGTGKGDRQVLVCAPSNVAVDHLTERIAQTGVKVVRLSAKSREHISSQVEHLTLHHMIAELEGNKATTPTPPPLPSSQRGGGGTRARNSNKSTKSRNLERQLLKAADVVCCTCSGAGDPRLESMKFRRVLLDEATQATEPESLIPIVMGCEQFILVGDHCQLGPVVMSKRAANAGLNSSLFERLVTLQLRPARLQVQYRMHPCLSEWPSNTFYEGSLQNGVSPGDRSTIGIEFPWIDSHRPTMFLVCQGSEEISATGTSFLNRVEAMACEKVVTSLLRGGAQPGHIGIITPYEGQRTYIIQQLKNTGPMSREAYAEIEVSSVDAFQGREKEYIIVSCVRSNEKQGIGFLNDPRRLNVALTRAKRGMILLGNPKVLAKRPLWNDLLVHYRERGLLVEGALNNLQVSLMKFPTARKYYRDARQRMLENAAMTVFSGNVADPYGEHAAREALEGKRGLGDFDYAVGEYGVRGGGHDDDDDDAMRNNGHSQQGYVLTQSGYSSSQSTTTSSGGKGGFSYQGALLGGGGLATQSSSTQQSQTSSQASQSQRSQMSQS